MDESNTSTYSASFRDLELRICESNGYHFWSVTDSKSGEAIAEGETADLESAMVAAAQAAQSDWGTVKWRGADEDDDNNDDAG